MLRIYSLTSQFSANYLFSKKDTNGLRNKIGTALIKISQGRSISLEELSCLVKSGYNPWFRGEGGETISINGEEFSFMTDE